MEGKNANFPQVPFISCLSTVNILMLHVYYSVLGYTKFRNLHNVSEIFNA